MSENVKEQVEVQEDAWEAPAGFAVLTEALAIVNDEFNTEYTGTNLRVKLRRGQIDSIQHGRGWYVNLDAFRAYVQSQQDIKAEREKAKEEKERAKQERAEAKAAKEAEAEEGDSE